MANTIEIVIRSKDEASAQIQGLVGKIGKALGGIAKIAAGIGLAKIFDGVTRSLSGMASESILVAARSRELASVLDLLGARAGWTADQIDDNVRAMMDLGIRSDVSRGLLAQFARYQLDAADATNLARVAQDAAVLSMKDSSEALDNIMHGVLTQNSLVLRNAGLNIQASKAMDAYAASMGRVAKDLTETERIQAMMNAVMEEGTRIAGAYDTAMEEPGKRLRSLNRHFYEIKNTIGDAFMPAFGNAIGIVEKITKWFRSAIEEGGFLRDTLLRIGAAADILSGKLGEMTAKALEAGEGVYSELGGKLAKTAEDALRWGINIVTQFASGIVQGAAATLTVAMNYISRMLRWFLGPGSPPRVALDIDKWGAAAMVEYLRGFTTASFDVLEGIQRPLSSVLTTLVYAGVMEATEAAEAFRDVGSYLTHAVSEFQQSGALTEALFERLSAVGGAFGEQLVELAKRQFAVAAAADRMREATERLVRAQTEQETAQGDLARITDEYNMLLLRGASYEELVAKRAEKAAAERRATQTSAAVEAAEVEKAAAEEQMDAERERLDLQQRLVQQMELLARAQADVVPTMLERIMGGAPEAGGGAGLALPGMPVDVTPITRTLDEAFEQIKQGLLEKWSDLFAPLVEEWEKNIQPALDELAAAWENFTSTVKEFYDRYLKPVVDGVAAMIPPETRDAIVQNMGKIVGSILALAGIVTIAKGAIALFSGAILALLSPLGLLVLALIGLTLLWEKHGEVASESARQLAFIIVHDLNVAATTAYQIMFIVAWALDRASTAATQLWQIIKFYLFKWLNEASTAATQLWQIVTYKLFDGLNTLSTFLTDTLAGAWDSVASAISNVIGWIDTAIQKLASVVIPDWLRGQSPPPMATWFSDIAASMQEMADVRLPSFGSGVLGVAPGARTSYPATSTSSHIYIERLVVEGVHDAPGLLQQLQEMAV